VLAGAVLALGWSHAEETRKNEYGHSLWKSKSESEVLKMETEDYNIDAFKAKLSRFGLHEWSHLSDEQQKKAMDLADNSQFSPDVAVFKVSRAY
jgi:hypothetical protein